MASSRRAALRLALWVTVFAVWGIGFIRYLQEPSFWLDEAFVAVSLKSFEFHKMFAPLEFAQFFPRLYLSVLGFFREVFGYHIWVLRLLPFSCFVAATLLWARLLVRRSSESIALAIFGLALLLGSGFWLDQAIQVKQYSFDVLLALIPFLTSDLTYDEALLESRSKIRFVFLILPCAVSYTYPFALFGRVIGWYLWKSRRDGWKLKPVVVVLFFSLTAVCLLAIWLTDHRYNLQYKQLYYDFWSDCILLSQLPEGIGSIARLLANFLWGWHEKLPIVTAIIIPLQIIGLISVIRRWRHPGVNLDQDSWGARSLGSIIVLGGVVLASLLLRYPMCANRLTLFSQIHIQIITLEGGLFLIDRFARKGVMVVAVAATIVLLYSGQEYVQACRSAPPENLYPVISSIDPQVANIVVVSICSVAQVRSLPEILPAQEVMFGFKEEQVRGERVWVLWSHMGADICREELEQIHSKATNWQVVKEKNGVTLALAEF